MPEASELVESVVRQLAATVEPNTRFDRSSLPIVGAETGSFRVAGTHGYEVSFWIELQNGSGPLPAGIRDFGSQGALDAHGAEQLAAVRGHLPARLRDWMAGQPTLPGRALAPGDCYHSGPPVGFAYQCQNCNGKGKVTCPHCFGAGKQTCLMCLGRGKVTCSKCAGSGYQHVLAALRCSVEQSFTLVADSPLQEAKITIESLGSLEKLCELTSVQLRHASAEDHSITRQFETLMPLVAVTVQAADQDIEILGYGDAARVFDFKNIVGALLKNDLDDLELVLQRAPRFPLRPMHGLDNTLRQFLMSEVNSRIGSVVGANREALQKLAAHGLHGAVSEEYVVHAAKAVRKATSRVFRSEMSVPALVAAGIPALLLAIIPLLNPHWRSDSGWVALWSLPVLGFVAERWALTQYRARFDAELAERAVALLRAKRTLWWWRLAILLVAIVGAFGYFAILVMVEYGLG